MEANRNAKERSLAQENPPKNRTSAESLVATENNINMRNNNPLRRFYSLRFYSLRFYSLRLATP
jgi:hypothetical protein